MPIQASLLERERYELIHLDGSDAVGTRYGMVSKGYDIVYREDWDGGGRLVGLYDALCVDLEGKETHVFDVQIGHNLRNIEYSRGYIMSGVLTPYTTPIEDLDLDGDIVADLMLSSDGSKVTLLEDGKVFRKEKWRYI